MRLMALNEWRQRRFVEPRPSARTCQNWCVKGDIPAIRRGKLWFIDIDQELNQSGNELADAVLKAS